VDLAAAGLQEQPFRTHGRPLIFVPYASQKAAFKFLKGTHAHNHGLGLFQGAPLSGKTTIIRHFTELLPEDCAVAVVDGAGMNTTDLMQVVLSQFGYELQFSSVNELINMVKVFVMQQAASEHAPLLVVENTHALNPSALRVLCELAGLKVNGKSALRLVLASDRSISPIVHAPSMAAISERLTGDFHLEPLTEDETTDYLYAKLRRGGCEDPQAVLPHVVCAEVHTASGGWPGIVDRLVLLALAKTDDRPVRVKHIERPVLPDNESKGLAALRELELKLKPDDDNSTPPRIILTYNGKTLREMDLEGSRLLIGRSQHNDLCIDSKFISRHHALFIRHGKTTFVMDLNSTNGTFVNSRRISNQVVIDNDIISIGSHGLKFIDPNCKVRSTLEGAGFSDTIIAKSLEDMRNVLARENTQALPIPSELRKSAGDSD